jgi:hypothetical protein
MEKDNKKYWWESTDFIKTPKAKFISASVATVALVALLIIDRNKYTDALEAQAAALVQGSPIRADIFETETASTLQKAVAEAKNKSRGPLTTSIARNAAVTCIVATMNMDGKRPTKGWESYEMGRKAASTPKSESEAQPFYEASQTQCLEAAATFATAHGKDEFVFPTDLD